VVVVVPVNANVDEAEEVAEKNWYEGLDVGPVCAVGDFHFEHHDGDDDGEDAIGEGFHTVFCHGDDFRAFLQPNAC
jgi:hypothetical protein